MTKPSLVGLRVELAAEDLTTGPALERAFKRIADFPDDPEAIRHKALIDSAGAIATQLVTTGAITHPELADQLGLDNSDSVVFIRALSDVWRFAHEIGVHWLDLCGVTIERAALMTTANGSVKK